MAGEENTKLEIGVGEPQHENAQKSKLAELIAKQLDPADPTPLNPYEIKNYIYFGFSERSLRPKYWRLLLNHFSPNQFKTELYFRKCRSSYNSMRENIQDSENTEDVDRQIKADLVRSAVLRSLEPAASEAINRILLLYATREPEMGYIQGMIQLVTPIYFVLSTSTHLEDVKYAEEDTFFMFRNLMGEIGENFGVQQGESTVRKRIDRVLEIVSHKDPELHRMIMKKGLHESGLGIRWILLLFSGDFNMRQVLWLWDRLLSDAYRFEMVEYCSASVLILLRNILMTQEFDKCMEVLQDLSIIEVEVMFDIADVLRREQKEILKEIAGILG